MGIINEPGTLQSLFDEAEAIRKANNNKGEYDMNFDKDEVTVQEFRDKVLEDIYYMLILVRYEGLLILEDFRNSKEYYYKILVDAMDSLVDGRFGKPFEEVRTELQETVENGVLRMADAIELDMWLTAFDYVFDHSINIRSQVEEIAKTYEIDNVREVFDRAWGRYIEYNNHVHESNVQKMRDNGDTEEEIAETYRQWNIPKLVNPFDK